MTPGPNLQDIIDTVKADASSADPLDQLATASRTVAELEAVGDSVLSHFVDQCRRSGRSWSEISAALGVSKQAAHKRFSLAAASLERWTPRARTALRAAASAAHSLGHGYVGTEHLLLGLFEPAGGIAARILDELGFTRATVEEQILRVTRAVVDGHRTAVTPAPRRSSDPWRSRTRAQLHRHRAPAARAVRRPDGFAAKILAKAAPRTTTSSTASGRSWQA